MDDYNTGQVRERHVKGQILFVKRHIIIEEFIRCGVARVVGGFTMVVQLYLSTEESRL